MTTTTISAIDAYLQRGCGRCDRYDTPDCKVHSWQEVLVALREVALQCGLTEECKWSQPCYTHAGKNIVMIAAFNDNCTLSFFRGALLSDPKGILEKPGVNSQVARVVRFHDVAAVHNLSSQLKELIKQAIDVARSGERVQTDKRPEPMPAELQSALAADTALNKAFTALTPGRQRSYILHVSAAKQAATRASRVEKCREKILRGEGFNERYSGKTRS